MSNRPHRDHDQDVPPEDAELFRRAVADARELHTGRAEPRRPRPEPRAHFTRRESKRVMQELRDDPGDPETAETGEELRFARPEVRPGVLRRLRRGRYSIQADFDLHGMSAAAARQAVDWFIDDAVRQGLSCVRIIHGKGLRSANSGPVLKSRIGGWLRRRREVLAFASARPVDGGTGAVCVLLRRP